MQFCLSRFSRRDLPSFSRSLSAFSFENPEFSCRSQAKLLHDLFGPLPFRSIRLNPSGRTPQVLALAQEMYDTRAFNRLPVLADALEEAGCQDADLLAHCR